MSPSLNPLIDLLFPIYCCCCGLATTSGGIEICAICLSQLPIRDRDNIENSQILDRFYGRVNISYAISFSPFSKGGIMQKIISQLKYHNRPLIGYQLGYYYGAMLKKNKMDSYFNVVVPIALHPKRLRMRGYNQSLFIAKGVADALGVVVADILIRHSFQNSQTKRGRYDRWCNLEDCFSVLLSGVEWQKKMNVLVVDDVITTGATLMSAVSAIEKSNISYKNIGVFALAYS